MLLLHKIRNRLVMKELVLFILNNKSGILQSAVPKIFHQRRAQGSIS